MNATAIQESFIKTATEQGYDPTFLEGYFKQANEICDAWSYYIKTAAELTPDPQAFIEKLSSEVWASHYIAEALTPGYKQAVDGPAAPQGGFNDTLHNLLNSLGSQVGGALGMKDTGGGLGGTLAGGGGGAIIGLILSSLFNIPMPTAMLLGTLLGGAAGGAYGSGAIGKLFESLGAKKPVDATSQAGAPTDALNADKANPPVEQASLLKDPVTGNELAKTPDAGINPVVPATEAAPAATADINPADPNGNMNAGRGGEGTAPAPVLPDTDGIQVPQNTPAPENNAVEAGKVNTPPEAVPAADPNTAIGLNNIPSVVPKDVADITPGGENMPFHAPNVHSDTRLDMNPEMKIPLQTNMDTAKNTVTDALTKVPQLPGTQNLMPNFKALGKK